MKRMTRSGRLVWLSLICGCLLVSLLYMRQYRPLPQVAMLDETSANLGGSLLHNREMKAINMSEDANDRRISYGEAIGKQHEERRKSEAQGVRMGKQEDHQSNGQSNAVQAGNAFLEEGPRIAVRLSETNKLEQIPLEQYVLGVALAELPGSFEPEAIKAQMLAARTYIVHRLVKLSGDVQDSVYEVSDTTADQVYMSLEQIEQYKQQYPDYYNKFINALKETKGYIISYEGQPIDAVFFSTSNGFTEDAEQVWGQQVTYLQSVASPWDQDVSPKYETVINFTFSELYDKLNLKQSRRDGKLSISDVSRNDSGRIQELKVNGASFSGRELREKLALASTAIEWRIDEKEKTVSFICYGYGHGIGLSQWGANGMALQGYQAEDIIQHYYSGVKIEQASKLVNKI